MSRLVYDTGMLVALDRGVPHAWRLHLRASQAGGVPVVPVMVLAQAWRGGPQPRLSRALRGCQLLPATESLARGAGTLCGRAATSDVIDALVVVVAAHFAGDIVTADLDDLGHLAEIHGDKVALHRV